MQPENKIYIGIIIFLFLLTIYFANRKIEVVFSKPTNLIGISTTPDRQDIFSNK